MQSLLRVLKITGSVSIQPIISIIQCIYLVGVKVRFHEILRQTEQLIKTRCWPVLNQFKAILQNIGPGFISHGIPRCISRKIFHGNSMEFHVEYSIQFPWNFMKFHGIPWSSM